MSRGKITQFRLSDFFGYHEGVRVAGLLVMAAAAAAAEPSFPPVCARLDAVMAAVVEASPDTARIQAALNGCAAGEAVELKGADPNRVFLTGPIQLPKGVTLIVDAGITLFASRNPRDYDADSRQQCGTIQTSSSGCLPLITANRADGAGVMGYGTIDGRGQLPMMPGGVAGTTTWWDLADRANAMGLSQNNFRLITVNNTNGFTLYKITLKNSPNFHVVLNTSTNITAWGVKIIAPYDARNTDGIDPIYSSNVTIANSWISTGDDNIALNGSQPGAFNVSAVNDWFGDGHGASIGSFTNAGVSDVLFDRITIAGTAANGNQNGIRIKSDVSRGGLVQRITYSNFCMKDVRHAIVIDPFYTAGATGSLVPQYKNITLRNVHATTEGTVKIQGHDAGAPTTMTMEGVQVDGIRPSDVTAQWAAITVDGVNFASMLQGQGVGVTQVSNPFPATVSDCPAQVFSPVAGELIPGAAPGTVLVQVFATKAVPYQTYLTRLKTDPNASLSLPAPTGTVTLYDGSTAVGSAALDASGLTGLSVTGSHVLTASYSGDANYVPITFGKLAVGLDPPRISSNGVLNGASFKAEIAPGSLFSIFGANLGGTAVQAAGYPLGTSLGGVSVQVTAGGKSYDAWMMFSSAGQVNAILPSSVPPGSAQVTVTYLGQTSAPAAMQVMAVAPGLFLTAQNVANATEYPLNTATSPAKPGQIVVLWATGLGAIAGADNVAPGAGDMTALPVTITVGGVQAERLYAGRQPQFAGVDNIYFKVPEGVAPGCQVPVAITAGGFAANTTNIAVTVDGGPCR